MFNSNLRSHGWTVSGNRQSKYFHIRNLNFKADSLPMDWTRFHSLPISTIPWKWLRPSSNLSLSLWCWDVEMILWPRISWHFICQIFQSCCHFRSFRGMDFFGAAAIQWILCTRYKLHKAPTPNAERFFFTCQIDFERGRIENLL